MTRMAFLGAALVAAFSTAGCSAGPNKSADAGLPEELVRVWMPEAGYVRGTRGAVAGWGRPLKAIPGPNRTVEPCRVMVQAEAEKLGARAVEAVSAGPHRRNPKGEWIAPVRMRITYPHPDGYEVKETTMTCITDRENRIVDAFT